ncbi:MAG: ADP-ribosylation factor family protein [Promethearchaeota archaeon]
MSFLARLRAVRAQEDHFVKIVWLGLDCAGKTTLVKRIHNGEFDKTNVRTLGMSIEEIESSDGIRLVCWDLGGQETFRDSLWKRYLLGAMAVIYVIDSADQERFSLAKQELWRYVIDNDDVKNIPILVLANKQDLEGAASAGQIARALNLHIVTTHSYAIFPTSAKTGFNVEEALEWLRQRIVGRLKVFKI